MKIIHLTDLHIGKGNCENVFSTIVSNIIGNLKDPDQYIIIVTGDLVDEVESKNEYVKVKKYLRKLTMAGFEVLVVPGNHDYGKGIKGEEMFVSLFKEVFFGKPNQEYPKTDFFNNIAFIGLDSMEKEIINGSVLADGKLGEPQLTELKRLLNDDQQVMSCSKRVVYLHHRPFKDYFGPGHFLKDNDELREIVKGKIDLLLFGHRHKHHNYNGHPDWHIPRIYDGGSSTKVDGEYAPHRIIDIFDDFPVHDIDGNFYQE